VRTRSSFPVASGHCSIPPNPAEAEQIMKIAKSHMFVDPPLDAAHFFILCLMAIVPTVLARCSNDRTIVQGSRTS
jgi:hypothetical protein